MKYGPLVYVDTRTNYYARYENGICTHSFDTTEPLTQYWVELIRVDPLLIEQHL